MLPLNGRIGIDYFMEDWMCACDYLLDQITLINVDQDKIKWITNEFVLIESDNPYNIASKLAINDWSWSNNAVIAVIEEDIDEEYSSFSNRITGKIDRNIPLMEENFNLEQKNNLNPIFREFDVCEDYSFIKAEVWWDGVIIKNTMIPYSDPDLQLYFKQNDRWIQTSASSYWNILNSPGYENTQSYVYSPGTWKIELVDYPIKSIPSRIGIPGFFEIQGSILQGLLPRTTHHVTVTKYPGITINLTDNFPYGCKEAEFKLTWNNPDICLGFSIIGPGGEVISTVIDESKTFSQNIHLESIGECNQGENYSICVFSLDDVTNPIGFEIEYSWKQKMSNRRRDSLTSATEGAVLASQLNIPLLYTSSQELSKNTRDTLFKLGVKNVYIVDIGDYIKDNVRNEIKSIVNIKENYKDLKNLYNSIRKITASNDVVFSTVDPWSYWYLGDLEPAGEKKYSLHVGPAAYTAAHHGSPVIIIDNHPRLSSAVVWHNEFWRRNSKERDIHNPSTAEMILTGESIYNFLEEFGFDSEGKENIITVAGQYDIGPSWDRIFTGVANPGRFWGSPVDCSYWISRNIFYPSLIYANPALNGLVELINGSVSKRDTGFHIASLEEYFSTRSPLISYDLNILKKIQKSDVKEYSFPVLCSFISYTHRFNERASKYYGAKYICADGLIPGSDPSREPIDEGSIYKYTGNSGSYFPDMTESEVVPFYLRKGGYDCVFSTNIESVINNSNNGVILWIHSSDGSHNSGGSSCFWNPVEGFKYYSRSNLVALIFNIHRFLVKEAADLLLKRPGIKLFSLLGYTYFIRAPFYGFEPAAGVFEESNPWRCYEWYTGSTKEPDTMSIDLKGVIPYSSIKIPFVPATGIDWVIASKPMKDMLNKMIPLIDIFDTNNINDGVIGTLTRSSFQFHEYKSTVIEEEMRNLHSTGFITNMCQTANTYLHLMLIRHGSVFQVQNPWTSSIYGAVWQQSIPRDIILGYTAGEAYTRGISHVGNLYLGDDRDNDKEPQFTWDASQNVIFYGDPNLRVYVPSKEYSNDNYWEKPDVLEKNKNVSFLGHFPYGAYSHPNSKVPMTIFQLYLILISIILMVVIFSVFLVYYLRRRK